MSFPEDPGRASRLVTFGCQQAQQDKKKKEKETDARTRLSAFDQSKKLSSIVLFNGLKAFNTGLINNGWYGSLLRRRANARNVTGLHTISQRRKTYHINLCWSNPYSAYSLTQKKQFFLKLVFQCLKAFKSSKACIHGDVNKFQCSVSKAVHFNKRKIQIWTSKCFCFCFLVFFVVVFFVVVENLRKCYD